MLIPCVVFFISLIHCAYDKNDSNDIFPVLYMIFPKILNLFEMLNFDDLNNPNFNLQIKSVHHILKNNLEFYFSELFWAVGPPPPPPYYKCTIFI